MPIIYRLTSAQASGGSLGAFGLQTYSYNATSGNLESKAGVSYSYGDAAHKHAVTGLSNGNMYQYDANGNMTQRVVGGQTYNLTYDAESRLTAVSGAVTASFSYNPDGERVKSVVNGVTTVYVGEHYEWRGNTSDSIKYYFAGTKRFAMRVGTQSLKYLLGDHLGSTSVALAGNGSVKGSQGYLPWGEVRFGSVPTEYQYTGQYNQASVGLYFYKARWYDSSLGRFTSADTVIPEASQGVQAWDRFAYVNNSPVRYNDPSGHDVGCSGAIPECRESSSYEKPLDEITVEELRNPFPPGPPFRPTPINPAIDLSPIINPALSQPSQPKTSKNIFPRISAPQPYIGPHSNSTGEPDYVTINGTAGLPGSPAGVSASVTMDYYSNIYGGIGINVGKSYYTGWSGAVTGGWIGGTPFDIARPPELEAEVFLTGLAINASGGAGAGGGITWSPFAPKGNQIATEVGAYTPQIGITISWNWIMYDHR